jgi:phosphomannomutase
MQDFGTSPLLHDVTEKLRNAYFSYLQDMSHSRYVLKVLLTTLNPINRDQNLSTSVKFVSTAMHGVGHDYAARAFEVFGFPPFTPVEDQKDPDPNFPTVRFPNPEEKGRVSHRHQTII